MNREQALEHANEVYQLSNDLGHAEATISTLQDVVDVQQDEIAHLQAELITAEARACTCGGEQ
jgi:hypothetical protein